MDVSRPPLPHLPGMDAGPSPLSHLPGAEQFDPPLEPPKPRSGFIISAATAVFSAALAIGILGTWWLFLNKSGSSMVTAKDESRIISTTTAPRQVVGLLPGQEPPLPSQNPLRQVMAQATAIPVQQALESAPAQIVPAKNIAVVKRKLAPTPYQPIDAPGISLVQAASIQKQLPNALAATAADQEKPVSVQDPEPQKPSAGQQDSMSVKHAEPEIRVAQRTLPTEAAPAVRKKAAVVQPQPAPQASQQPVNKPQKPAQVARAEPQAPETSDKLEPREKALQPLSKTEEQRILRRGADLSELGDIAGARLVLEYAALRGNAEAMYALAQTFDPDYLATRGVVGVAPNVEVSVKWYSKAAQFGIDAAGDRVRVLESQVGQRR